MINTLNLEEAKRLLKKEQSPKIILANGDLFNRKILEYGRFDIILSLEKGNRIDKLRQIDSGFNHVLALIANKNNVAMGIDLDELKHLSPKEKAERISKIMQNVFIARKYKTKIAVKTHSIEAARAFLLGIGASTSQLNETIVF